MRIPGGLALAVLLLASPAFGYDRVGKRFLSDVKDMPRRERARFAGQWVHIDPNSQSTDYRLSASEFWHGRPTISTGVYDSLKSLKQKYVQGGYTAEMARRIDQVVELRDSVIVPNVSRVNHVETRWGGSRTRRETISGPGVGGMFTLDYREDAHFGNVFGARDEATGIRRTQTVSVDEKHGTRTANSVREIAMTDGKGRRVLRQLIRSETPRSDGRVDVVERQLDWRAGKTVGDTIMYSGIEAAAKSAGTIAVPAVTSRP